MSTAFVIGTCGNNTHIKIEALFQTQKKVFSSQKIKLKFIEKLIYLKY